jgi:chromosome segregation ATPase
MSEIDDSALLHMRPSEGGARYDPVKAREYYLRTRKLKGRTKSAIVTTAPRTRVSEKPTSKPSASRKPKKTSEQKRKEAQVKVDALKGRLAKLKALLAKLVAEAKGRSGVEPKKDTTNKTESPKEKATRNATAKDRKPLTTEQKAEARKRSKEYYQENKTAQKDESTSKEIAQVQAQIKEVRSQLKKALENAKKDSKGRASGKDSLADINKVLDSVFKDLGVK